MTEGNIHPVILAAGPSPLGLPTALASFGDRTALEIALANCAGLRSAIVVVGSRSSRLRALVPPGARLLINRDWRRGQIASLRLALRHLPAGADFMLYPVDVPLLTPALVGEIVRAFQQRPAGKEIVMPRHRGRNGHPVIFSALVAPELRRAPTARDVVYRDPRRLLFLAAGSAAIYRDMDTPAAYRACLREFKRSAEAWPSRPANGSASQLRRPEPATVPAAARRRAVAPAPALRGSS